MIRATELLCYLNSKNSDAGLSTGVMFCDVAGCPNLRAAAKDNYRICTSLRYLKELGIKIISSSSQPSLDTTGILEGIRSTLSLQRKAIVYTDGSTSPRNNSPNSGSGIFITDEKHQPLWSGGFAVRSDGNNFVAELAAAAVVLKACPLDTALTIRIDSMATIGALSNRVLSEKRRIRASGRAWLNFCRAEIGKKRVLIEHVSSHTGAQTNEQRGNDVADAMANKFRLHGESIGPVPYLVSTEEPLLLESQGLIVQGDPRKFLKKMTKERMANIWRTKPKQAEWFIKHPVQLLKQAKQVWKWAVESGNGRSWLYYIFGVCQWLPTNHRINYSNSEEQKRCSLCLSGSQETLEHLLRCPALIEHHISIKTTLQSAFEEWRIPYCHLPLFSRRYELQSIWKNATQKSSLRVPPPRLDILTYEFWKINQAKPCLSTRNFLESLSKVLQNRVTSPFCTPFPRQDLLCVLIQELSLETHAFTDSLHFSPLFENWSSIDSADLPFGGKLWTEPTMHRGLNAFFFHGQHDQINTQGLLEVFAESLDTNQPTRFVCLVPSQDKLPPHFLELATFRSGAPLFGLNGTDKCISEFSMSIVLAANKESLQVDPINWEKLMSRLKSWNNDYITIPSLTNALFRERESLSHLPRALSKRPQNVLLNSHRLLNFYDPFAPMEKSPNVGSLPPRASDLIARMNRHPRFLSLLGILPNQFRQLLKEFHYENRENAIFDLSRTLFLAGFRIWEKRSKLASRFWKNIAPENRKLHQPQRKIRKKRNKQEIENDAASSKCKNPFHFLKRHQNLSNKRRTRCPCSKAPLETKQMPNRLITTFVSSLPVKSHLHDMTSRTDKIRAQHDRGKKRKVTDLLDFKQGGKKIRVQHANVKKRKRKVSPDLKQSKIKFGNHK